MRGSKSGTEHVIYVCNQNVAVGTALIQICAQIRHQFLPLA